MRDESRTGLFWTLSRLRQVFVDLAIVVVAGAGLVTVLPALLKPTLVIEAISVPTSLEERGFSGEVVSRKLRDELRAIQVKARPTILTSLKLADTGLEDRFAEIETATGNLRWAIMLIREALGLEDLRVSGEMTAEAAPQPPKKRDDDEDRPEPPPKYRLNLRSRDAGPFHETQAATEDIQVIVRTAAISILEQSNPVLAGRYHEISRRYDDAERMAFRLIRSPKPAEVEAGIILRGNVKLRRGQFDAAIADYEEVLKTNPKSTIAAINIAWAHFRAERYEPTIAAAERAMVIDPKAASPYAHKANALRLLGRASEAVPVALAGADLEPANGQPLTALTAAYNVLRRPQEALEAGLRAIERDPNYGSAHSATGFALQALGRQAEAIERMKKGVELDPTWDRGWYFLGMSLRRGGKDAEAAQAFGKAAEVTPATGEFHFEQAVSLLKVEQLKPARLAFERAVERNHKPADALFSIAQIASKTGDVPVAIDAFRRASELLPRNEALWADWAGLLMKRKRIPEAVTILAKGRETLPGSVKLTRLHGDALLAINDRANALKAYETVIGLDASQAPGLEPTLQKLRRRLPVAAAAP